VECCVLRRVELCQHIETSPDPTPNPPYPNPTLALALTQTLTLGWAPTDDDVALRQQIRLTEMDLEKYAFVLTSQLEGHLGGGALVRRCSGCG